MAESKITKKRRSELQARFYELTKQALLDGEPEGTTLEGVLRKGLAYEAQSKKPDTRAIELINIIIELEGFNA